VAADRAVAVGAGALTRRRVLAGGLAAAGTLAACTPAAPPRPAGGLVGLGPEVGHALRGGAAWPTAARTERTAVVIVGGGVAGLAVAWHLARAGVRDFVLLEMEATTGGNARAGVSAVTAYPWGAHYLPLPGPEARGVRALLRALGVIEREDARGRPVYDERHLCHAPHERLFIHGRWQDGLFPSTGASGDDLAQYEAFRREIDRLRAWRDGAGRRAFAVPRAAGAPGAMADLDRVSMAAWLARRGWTSPRLGWFVEYACRDDFGTALAQTSAWAAMHYYAARDPDPEYGDTVLTWPEGNGWLTRRMAAAAGERAREGWLVHNVEPGDRGVTVDAYAPATGAGARLEAREVVLACPVMVAARIYRPWRERPPGFVRHFRYAPWLVANLHCDAPPAPGAGVPLAWDNVLYESESLGYVVATHQALRSHPGPTVLTYYRPFPSAPEEARRRLLVASWTALRDAVLADLARAHPDLTRLTRRIDVVRYGHAMVRPEPGFVCGPALAAAGRALRGPVHLAHGDLSGFSLFEEAFDWGSRVAARLLARLGHGRRATL
jgi:glycine/D-amino acid oxidase-like deaminating enzyme